MWWGPPFLVKAPWAAWRQAQHTWSSGSAPPVWGSRRRCRDSPEASRYSVELTTNVESGSGLGPGKGANHNHPSRPDPLQTGPTKVGWMWGPLGMVRGWILPLPGAIHHGLWSREHSHPPCSPLRASWGVVASTAPLFQRAENWTALVARWLRIYLPMQRAQVPPWSWGSHRLQLTSSHGTTKDPTAQQRPSTAQ